LTRRELASLAAAAAAGLGVSAWLQRRPRPAEAVTLTPVVRAVLSDPGSPAAGSAAPEVTIVLFTDYQCPICRATDPALQALLAADPTVRVIFKDWPIFGAVSKAAAKAALAAARQGKYLALHQGLMASRARLDRAQLAHVARAAGVDWTRLVAEEQAAGAALEAQLRRHALQAFSLGLEGTPAYLVGPYLIAGGLDARQLAQAVRRARAAGPPKPTAPAI
jgi:protein-disulfide isomerase